MRRHWPFLVLWAGLCAALTFIAILLLRQRAAVIDAAAVCPEANAIRKIRNDPSICWRDGDHGFVCYSKKLDIEDTPNQPRASVSPIRTKE